MEISAVKKLAVLLRDQLFYGDIFCFIESSAVL